LYLYLKCELNVFGALPLGVVLHGTFIHVINLKAQQIPFISYANRYLDMGMTICVYVCYPLFK